ncbi:MAG: TerC family protein [Thermoanaerobaculia bacterium]
MEWITDPNIWIAFLTLLVLEVVLGIDNIVFLSILTAKLPADQQPRARGIGLGLAMVLRIALLLAISWLARLTAPLFAVIGHDFSGRDLILLVGGLFLVAKSTHEIHQKLEGEEGAASARVPPRFASVIAQILLLDLVFSLDSVITAVGMVQQIPVMVAAIVGAVTIMIFFAGPVSSFVDRHPTVKMLALAFLLLIGVTLIAEGMGQHISKGYVYFAMAFSVFVEMLNLRLHKRVAVPVHLREKYVDSKDAAEGSAKPGSRGRGPA